MTSPADRSPADLAAAAWQVLVDDLDASTADLEAGEVELASAVEAFTPALSRFVAAQAAVPRFTVRATPGHERLGRARAELVAADAVLSMADSRVFEAQVRVGALTAARDRFAAGAAAGVVPVDVIESAHGDAADAVRRELEAAHGRVESRAVGLGVAAQAAAAATGSWRARMAVRVFGELPPDLAERAASAQASYAAAVEVGRGSWTRLQATRAWAAGLRPTASSMPGVGVERDVNVRVAGRDAGRDVTG